jgi:hypothetical protein
MIRIACLALCLYSRAMMLCCGDDGMPSFDRIAIGDTTRASSSTPSI